MREPVTKTPIDILLPWKAEIIPRRCRRLRPVYLYETVHAEIRTPASDEARIAFRLSCAHWRGRNTLSDGKMDVVYCDGTLWWPVSPLTEDVRSEIHTPQLTINPNHYIDADQLLGCIADGTRDLLALRNFQGIDLFEDLLRIADLPLVRVWKEDNKKEMEALAQRRASENLMIWKGKAFVRGGEPVYCQRPLDNHRSDDGMASVGASRAVDPYASGLPFDTGRFEWAQPAFMAGKFQRADERAFAEASRSPSARGSKFDDFIEVLMPEAIKLDRAAVRLDAIYRAADRALKAGDDPVWADMRESFAEVSARDPNGGSTSSDRFDALVRVRRLAEGRGDLIGEMQEVYESILAFESSGDVSDLGPSTLAPEDDAALGDLGEARVGQRGAA